MLINLNLDYFKDFFQGDFYYLYFPAPRRRGLHKCDDLENIELGPTHLPTSHPELSKTGPLKQTHHALMYYEVVFGAQITAYIKEQLLKILLEELSI